MPPVATRAASALAAATLTAALPAAAAVHPSTELGGGSDGALAPLAATAWQPAAAEEEAGERPAATADDETMPLMLAGSIGGLTVAILMAVMVARRPERKPPGGR